ncbi:hypothetical protein ABEO98_22640 [Brevibacillus parabrevis]|uniref:hypothetical protein n=1 Tax=Brevibacillus parabrevis TaxID=54914 RepID=UPI003D1F7AF4
MEALKCRSCKKDLTMEMEIEYSQFITEFFCGPDCATNHYFDYMQSTPVDLEDAEVLNDHEIKIVDGKLVIVEE